ncbi:MAG: amidohydrolase family protein, partial [Actinomycetota bacterium]
MNSYRIKGAKDSSGKVGNYFVSDGVFVNESELSSSAKEIDARGLTILPGFVDLHTHLREPGREDAETVLTGSMAAATGGFTAISAMPNTLPVADTAG